MSNRLHDNYMNDIGNTVIMTDAEEKALAVEIEKGSQEAINRLVGANLRYVVTLANTYKNRGMETEDLISEGNIGLMRAAARFHPEYRKRFVTFAAPFIRQSIEAAIAHNTTTDDSSKGLQIRSVDAPVPVGSQNTYTLLSILENTDAERSDQAVEQESVVDRLKKRLGRLDAPRKGDRYLLHRHRDQAGRDPRLHRTLYECEGGLHQRFRPRRIYGDPLRDARLHADE